MNLKNIPRDTILKPLQAVAGIVERRQTLPILANVLFEHSKDGLLTLATDLELQISAKIAVEGSDEPQSVTVSARKLLDILRALPESSTVTLEAKDGKLTVKAGKSRFSLQTLPASDYPRLHMNAEQLTRLSVSQRQLKATLRLVEFAMAQQDIRFYLNGMLLVLDGRAMQCVATDGHRLSYASLPLETEFARQEIIVPRKTVLELSKLLADSDDPVDLAFLSNQVRFTFGAIELTSKVIDGKFPDYNRVIPTAHQKHVTLERLGFLGMLQRAAILSNERFRGVRLSLAPGVLKVVCTNNEQEEAEEEIEVTYDGTPVDIGFNINYLLDVVGTLTASEITLSLQDPSASGLVTLPGRDDFKYVVMPMRI